MVRLISRQRGGLAALKLTKLFGIDDFPAAKDSGKVVIIIIYCYLIIIIIIIIINIIFSLIILVCITIDVYSTFEKLCIETSSSLAGSVETYATARWQTPKTLMRWLAICVASHFKGAQSRLNGLKSLAKLFKFRRL